MTQTLSLAKNSKIVLIDVIHGSLLIYEEGKSPYLLNLSTKKLTKISFDNPKACVELETSGETLILFENKVTILTPNIINLPIVIDELIVCDNAKNIFILQENTVFVVCKTNYFLSSFFINCGTIFGCNEIEDEVFVLNDKNVYIFY